MSAALSRRLSMRDVAGMCGFGPEHGAPRASDVRRARRWLVRLERHAGQRVLYRERGAGCWTTLAMLRAAHPGLVETSLGIEERVDRLEERVDDHTTELRAIMAALRVSR